MPSLDKSMRHEARFDTTTTAAAAQLIASLVRV